MDNLWRDVSGWLWTLLLIPFAYLWKLITSAPTRTEWEAHLAEDRLLHVEFKATLKLLFENAERDRKLLNDALNDLRKDMHQIHVDLIQRIK